MQRRQFLARSGLVLGAVAAARPAQARQKSPPSAERTAPSAITDLSVWDAVRAQFDLDPDLIHMAGFFLVSHPAAVRQAIARHREALDANPIGYKQMTTLENEVRVLRAAGEYLGVRPQDIALTGSTTMGLSIMYGAIKLREEHEILTTTHDHYATWKNLELRSKRTGAIVRTIPLYADSAKASDDEIVSSLTANITPATRVAAVTWVHSGTGVKLPLRAMADAIAKVNQHRNEEDRIIFCVDGVHGLGVEDAALPDLGCDFFTAGTHKWMFGPRGTGILWGRPEAQNLLSPLIPPFIANGIMADGTWPEPSWGMMMSPGGFHAFEHRWAMAEAFRFHMQIGKQRVTQRIAQLNSQLKQGLAEMGHVTLNTPISPELSAGIVCFDVAGLTPDQIVHRLAAKNIIASVSPYEIKCARLAPSLLTSPEQVEATLREIRALA